MPRFSLRLGHARVLTVHRTVIHFARAASLRHPLQEILTFTVGAIHESPAFVCGMRLFSRGVGDVAPYKISFSSLHSAFFALHLLYLFFLELSIIGQFYKF